MKSKLVNHPESKVPWTWNLLNSKCIQQVLSNRQRGHAWEKNDHRYLEEILKRNSCWCRASAVMITAEIVDLLSYPETWPKPVSCKALTWVKIPAIHTNLNKFITFNNSNLVKKNLITATEMSWGSSPIPKCCWELLENSHEMQQIPTKL